MRVKLLLQSLFLIFSVNLFSNFIEAHTFIKTQVQLQAYYNKMDTLVIASIGRSGSTMLTDTAENYCSHYKILKCHLLPPKKTYKGKIIFIFSNPDLSAESVLHASLYNSKWGSLHFNNMESSDKKWLRNLSETERQTVNNNFLSYDALGYDNQLSDWLYEKTEPCDVKTAQILAVKYEHLWDKETIEAIESFLLVDNFALPPQKERGYQLDKITSKEASFRIMYNTGSAEKPKYEAYNSARELWEMAPPFQYLNIK